MTTQLDAETIRQLIRNIRAKIDDLAIVARQLEAELQEQTSVSANEAKEQPPTEPPPPL